MRLLRLIFALAACATISGIAAPRVISKSKSWNVASSDRPQRQKIQKLLADLKVAIDHTSGFTFNAGVSTISVKKANRHLLVLDDQMVIGSAHGPNTVKSEVTLHWRKITKLHVGKGVAFYFVAATLSEKTKMRDLRTGEVDAMDSVPIQFEKLKDARIVRDILKEILDALHVKYEEEEEDIG